MMRLYSFLHSPNPLKVRLALAELGLSFEPIEINLFRGEHRTSDFKKINPHAKVPVFEDGMLRLRESNAILVYLGQHYGGEKWPATPNDQAVALQWLFFESAHLSPNCGTIWWAEVVSPAIGRKRGNPILLEAAEEELKRSLNLLEEHLANLANSANFAKSPFLLGEAFTLVDCSVGATLSMLRKTRLDDANQWPHVINYRERIRLRPSWTAAQGDAIHHFK